MADNVVADAGSGGATFATDDVGGVHYPISKLAFGALDTANLVTSTGTNPLPVALSDTDNAVLDAIAASVAGTLSIDWGGTAPPIGAGLEATALRVTVATDSTGVLSVDDGGGALTVDGTVTANLSATDNAVLDAIAASVAGTLTVGSHAVTNAGTFAVQVDGDALTALQLIDNIVNTADSAAGGTPTGVAPLAVRDDSLSALTPVEGDFVPLRVNSTGALHVTGGGGGTQYAVDDAAGGTDTGTLALAIRDDSLTTLTPADGDYVGLRVNSTGALHVTGAGGGTQYNISDVAGATDTGTTALVVRNDTLADLAGTDGDYAPLQVNADGALYVSVADDDTGYSEDAATPATIVGPTLVMERDDALSTLTPTEGDWAALRCSAEGALWTQDFNGDTMVTHLATLAGAVSTEMQVDVVGALPAGTNAIGKLAANSGVDIGDVDVTSISAGSNLIGDVGISGARTSGGTTLYKNIDVDESEDQVKGTAGQVYWIHAMNLSSAVKYLKLYNATAASVTVGTTTPDLTFPIPTQGDTNGAGFTISIPNGIAFSTAITVAATTGVADNDSGAPGANEVVVNLGYA